MKKLIVILFACVYSFGFSQYVFNKLVDNNYQYDGGLSIIQTIDNGYIACGSTDNTSTLLLGLLITKKDSCGNIDWLKEYDYSWNGTDDGNSIFQIINGDYVILGNAFDSIEMAKDIFLFEINEIGDSIWYKTLEFGYNDNGITHKQTGDGGFIIGGYYTDTTISKTKVFLMKTDSFGNKEWQQDYGGNYYSYLKSIDFTPDGGYILSGDFENNATSSWDMFIIKTDSIGNFIWKKTYGSTFEDRKGYSVSTIDSGFVIVGYTKYSSSLYKAYIVKTDSLGNIDWEKHFGRTNEVDLYQFVQQLPDGSYVVAGSIIDTLYSSNPRVWLMKISVTGDSLWSRIHTYYGLSAQYAEFTYDYVEDLQLTNDGGFIMTGYIINNLLLAKNDLWLLKTDSLGNSCEIDTNTWEGCSELITLKEAYPNFIKDEMDIKIFPNPTTGKITIEAEEIESIEVFDIYGKYLTGFQNLSGLNETDLSTHPKGIYIIKVQTSRGVAVVKVILQ